MEEKSTHFVFDGEKVIISPDLHSIIFFLQEIEKEVETILNFDKKLESIRKQYLETIGFIEFLAKKLKDNSIDFSYNLKEKPETIAEKLKMTLPIRSEFIILFAHLEVLMCLNCAYDNKTSDENEIRRLVMNTENTKNFIKEFCLNSENNWGKKNKERLSYITVEDFRNLRNSLTHFFSVGKGLGVSIPYLDEKSRKLEIATKFKAKFISKEDLSEIIKGTAVLMMKKWTKDWEKSKAESLNEFKDKILCVRDTVDKYGAVIINNNQINI